MALSETDLFNLALSATGSPNLVDIPGENSREAKLLRLWYPIVRDTVLRAAPWGCARRSQFLALSSTRNLDLDWVETDPEPNWAYAYILPNDFLYPRFIGTFTRFITAFQNDVNVLLSNEPSAALTYTFRQTNTAAYDPDLANAIIFGLAAMVGPPLNGKLSRADRLLRDANNIILTAQTRNANLNNMTYEHLPSWMAARGAAASTGATAFVYPNGPLLSNDGVPVGAG